MKLPDRIIIDIRESAVIFEDRDRDILYESIPKLVYCQNLSDEGIDISIDISILSNQNQKKGAEDTDGDLDIYENRLSINIEGGIRNYLKESTNEQSFGKGDTVPINYLEIQDLFDKASRYPYDDELMEAFINYQIQGQECTVFEYKKELFKDALKEPKMNTKRRDWLKKNKIKLLNSRK